MVDEAKEIKRYYTTIDYIDKHGMAFLTLIDSHDINVKFTASCKIKPLEDRDLIIHEDKNFHLVIREDGSWDVYWIRNKVLSRKDLETRNKVFDELLEIYYERK